MTMFSHTSGITEIVAPIQGMYRAGDIGDGKSLTTAVLDTRDCWRWYNQKQIYGVAYQGTHALESTTVSSIKAKLGDTTRNGCKFLEHNVRKFS